MPKSTDFEASTSQESIQILSALPIPPPQQPTIAKTRNCKAILTQLGQQFGASLFQICPEILTYLSLDNLDTESQQGVEVS
jgi:hypothetical protein